MEGESTAISRTSSRAQKAGPNPQTIALSISITTRCRTNGFIVRHGEHQLGRSTRSLFGGASRGRGRSSEVESDVAGGQKRSGGAPIDECPLLITSSMCSKVCAGSKSFHFFFRFLASLSQSKQT